MILINWFCFVELCFVFALYVMVLFVWWLIFVY